MPKHVCPSSTLTGGAFGFSSHPESGRHRVGSGATHRRLQLIARLQPHIDKEEMALLPIVDDVIDRETDFELCALHAGNV